MEERALNISPDVPTTTPLRSLRRSEFRTRFLPRDTDRLRVPPLSRTPGPVGQCG